MRMIDSGPKDEAFAADLAPYPSRRGSRRVLLLIAPLLPVVLALIVWLTGGLERVDSPEKIAETARALRDSPAGFGYVMLGFGLGTLLFIPVTVMIAGTALAYDPVRGFAFAFIGVLFGASTTYWCGRLLGARTLDYFQGARLARVKHELCTRAFRASIIARLMPVGNFTVINLLAGGLRVPFRAYFLGNMVGALPGVIVLALFTDQLGAALRSPSATNITAVVVGLVVLAGLGFWLRRIMRRREREARGGLAP